MSGLTAVFLAAAGLVILLHINGMAINFDLSVFKKGGSV